MLLLDHVALLFLLKTILHFPILFLKQLLAQLLNVIPLIQILVKLLYILQKIIKLLVYLNKTFTLHLFKILILKFYLKLIQNFKIEQYEVLLINMLSYLKLLFFQIYFNLQRKNLIILQMIILFILLDELQWIAFFKVDIPYIALIDLGFICLAY